MTKTATRPRNKETSKKREEQKQIANIKLAASRQKDTVAKINKILRGTQRGDVQEIRKAAGNEASRLGAH